MIPQLTRSNERATPADAGHVHRSSRNENLVPLLCLLGAGAMLGLSTDLASLAGRGGLGPLAFLTWSIVGATMLLVVVGAFRGRLPSFNARTIEYFAVAGFVGLALPQLIFFAAVPHLGASFVALSVAFPPLYTYVGALVLRMERFHAWRALGVILALAGSVLLAVLKLSTPDVSLSWVLLTLAAPISLAVGNLYRTLRWPPGSTPDELAPGMLGAAGLMLLVAGVLPGLSLAVPTDSAGPIVLIIVQAVTFALLYLLFFVLQQRGGPVYLSLLGSVAAVVGSTIAIIFLGEAAPQGLAIGGLLMAAGVGLVTRGGANRSRSNDLTPHQQTKEESETT